MNRFNMKTVSVNGTKVRFTLPTDRITSILLLGLVQSGRNLTERPNQEYSSFNKS